MDNIKKLARETLETGKEYIPNTPVQGSTLVRFGKDNCLYFPIAVVEANSLREGELYRLHMGDEGNIALIPTHDSARGYKMRAIEKGKPHLKLKIPNAAIREQELKPGYLYHAEWVDAMIGKKKEHILFLAFKGNEEKEEP